MTYPPAQHGPGQQYGPGYGGPPQYAPPQYGYQPQQYPPQGQPFAPHGGPQYPHPGWGQPQPPRRDPVWKSPLVLIGGALVLVGVLVVAIVAVSGGGADSATTAAASSSAPHEAPVGASPSSTRSGTRSAAPTSKAATQSVSAGAQAILDAMPAPLRQVVASNKITEKDPVGNDSFRVKVVGTVPAKDGLTVGLLKTIDIDRYPIAWIDTDPDRLLRIWNSQHPEWLIDKGERKLRVDTSIPGGGATVETFHTGTKLYTVMSGFKDKDSALKYVDRAGL